MQQDARDSGWSFAEVALATPTMQAVQDSWTGLGIRHARGMWVFVTTFGESFHEYTSLVLWDISTVYDLIGLWGSTSRALERQLRSLYTGLFIAASCNSRSSHGQYTRSSTEHLQYGTVTSARLLGQNYKNRNYSKVLNYVLYIHSFFQPNNGTSLLMIAHALNTSNRPAS
jgi:hypothetical protein